MKQLLVIILLVTGFISCQKGEFYGTPNPIYNETIQVDLEGPDTVTINKLETVEIPYTLKYVAGTRVPVSVTVSGMPAHLVASFQTQIDSPTYNTVLKFIATNADTGLYQLTVTTASIDTTQTFPISLHIIPPPVNDAPSLVGNYVEQGPCTVSGNLSNSANISTVTSAINIIKILGIWGGGVQYFLTANIDPATKLLTIPTQPFGGSLTISGSGTYTTSPAKLDISYYVTDGNLVNDTCVTTFTK